MTERFGQLPLVLLIALAACDGRPEQWDAMIYPDPESDEGAVTIGGFKSAELCQQAAFDVLDIMGAAKEGTFACGHRCGPTEDLGGMRACETVINAEDF